MPRTEDLLSTINLGQVILKVDGVVASGSLTQLELSAGRVAKIEWQLRDNYPPRARIEFNSIVDGLQLADIHIFLQYRGQLKQAGIGYKHTVMFDPDGGMTAIRELVVKFIERQAEVIRAQTPNALNHYLIHSGVPSLTDLVQSWRLLG